MAFRKSSEGVMTRDTATISRTPDVSDTTPLQALMDRICWATLALQRYATFRRRLRREVALLNDRADAVLEN
jgi:hypothetical protein